MYPPTTQNQNHPPKNGNNGSRKIDRHYCVVPFENKSARTLSAFLPLRQRNKTQSNSGSRLQSPTITPASSSDRQRGRKTTNTNVVRNTADRLADQLTAHHHRLDAGRQDRTGQERTLSQKARRNKLNHDISTIFAPLPACQPSGQKEKSAAVFAAGFSTHRPPGISSTRPHKLKRQL